MALRIYNTLTRKKEEFVPLTPGRVGIYVCGVTVYDFSHVGHARSALAFDMIRRYLLFRGYQVKFVRNFTDVDDKIIQRAQREGATAHEISERYVAAEREDMAALGVLAPDVYAKATDHIPQMVSLIERLIAKGLAYPVEGDVYFEVARFPAYGRLSGKNIDELVSGARVEVDERKRDPRDFALWKGAKPGEPSWPSPWGPGRPGWHIECSAMAIQYLGETFDLHGGGEDLIFPHHECEIAQAEGVTGKSFVRCWMHNGLLNLGTEKMSKSLGNTLTIRELVKRHEPDAMRLYLLGAHYRHPLNAPQALGVLFDLARVLHGAREQVAQGTTGAGAFLLGVGELVVLARVLGLLEGARKEAVVDPQLKGRIESLIYLRREARRQRDFGEADRLRDELTRLGVVIEDTRDGTTWKLQS